MKLTKNSNILLIGLSLILSLVSFTGVADHVTREAIKTSIVIGDNSKDTRFSIQYQNVNKGSFISFSKFSSYSFIEFLNNYGLKEITAFKSYTHYIFRVRAEQLLAKLYIYSTNQTLYNDIV